MLNSCLFVEEASTCARLIARKASAVAGDLTELAADHAGVTSLTLTPAHLAPIRSMSKRAPAMKLL
jgi:hypothetical protein